MCLLGVGIEQLRARRKKNEMVKLNRLASLLFPFVGIGVFLLQQPFFFFFSFSFRDVG